MISSVNANEIITIDCDSCTTNKTININTTCIICNTNRSVEIAINNGMNLIGIPLYPTDPTLDAVFGDNAENGDQVCRYINGPAGGYKCAMYFFGSWNNAGSVEPIKPGVGYEYKRNGADYTLVVNGTYLPNNGYNNSKCISFKQKMINKTINLTTSYDGYIYYNYIDDEYFLNDNGNYLKMGSEEVMPKIYRSFVEFDISDIPKNANVTNVTFKYRGKYHYIICNITNMTVQPSQSNYDFIYNDIGFNTIYTNNTSFPIEGSDKSINLGLYAIEDLQKAINDSNWFSIGIKSCNETITNMSYIYASENIYATPPPTLMVEYQVPAEPVREELNIMFHEYNMHINIMTNPFEYIVTKLDNKVGTNIIRPRRCKEDD